MLKKDYKKLYFLQNKFFNFWQTLKLPFYLTGGTALGRFYLKHRHSEDLDFFINQDENFNDYMKFFAENLEKKFVVDKKNSLKYDTFYRFFIIENDILLKLEFVNDVPYRSGEPNDIYFGKIDTPLNILSNKISTIVNRDEPKDVFDIIYLALNYDFNWKDVFFESKEKNIINEIDVEQRINTFPVHFFDTVDWFIKKQDSGILEKYIQTIADDFITGSNNSLCKTNIKIEDAIPII